MGVNTIEIFLVLNFRLITFEAGVELGDYKLIGIICCFIRHINKLSHYTYTWIIIYGISGGI